MMTLDPVHIFYYPPVPKSTGDTDQDPEKPDPRDLHDEEKEQGKQHLSLDDIYNGDFRKAYSGTGNSFSGYKEVMPRAANSLDFSMAKLGESKVYYQPHHNFTPKEMIALVQSNGHVLNSLRYPKQDFSKGANNHCGNEISGTIRKNYRRTSDGALEMYNPDILRRQKQVLGSLMKQFGSVLFSGKSIMSISLPVVIFESRSQIEREASNLLYAPYYLEKAGQTMDKFEQFKITVSYFVASLHLVTNPQKPFNPVLGETFQGIIGGSPVYGEQISHHPPTLALQMSGKNFSFDGTIEFSASMSLNSVKSRKLGYVKIGYKNTGSLIRAQYPSAFMQGTAMGKRTFQYADKFHIFDIENRFYAEIDFDVDSHHDKKRAKALKAGKDFFVGKIWRINDDFAKKLAASSRKFQELEFKEKYHAVQLLESIEGCWLEYLKIGQTQYWTYMKEVPSKLEYFDNPLPSDSNYRLDLLYLKSGDELKAQEYKKLIEELQRKDKRLREQGK